jgi:hypothetical protein
MSCDELRERVDALLATSDTSDPSWSAIEANTDRAIELDALRAELESSGCG